MLTFSATGGTWDGGDNNDWGLVNFGPIVNQRFYVWNGDIQDANRLGWVTFTYEIVATTNPTRLSLTAVANECIEVSFSMTTTCHCDLTPARWMPCMCDSRPVSIVMVWSGRVVDVLMVLCQAESDALHQPVLLHLSKFISWHMAKQTCQEMGKDLCSSIEACPSRFGSYVNSRTFFPLYQSKCRFALGNPGLSTKMVTADMWMPVADFENEWMEVQEGDTRRCQSHYDYYGLVVCIRE